MMNITEKDFKYMVSCTMRDLTSILIAREGMDVKSALRTLYNSDTLKALQDPSTELYYQSPLHVYAYLHKEINTGKMYEAMDNKVSVITVVFDDVADIRQNLHRLS